MKNRKHKKLVLRAFGLLIIVMGAFLIGSSILLNVSQEKENKVLLSDMKEKRLENARTGIEKKDKEVNIEDCILRIPVIDSENPISEGTTKEALSRSLGHETGTALPGNEGNCVIAGHRNYTFGKYFNRLDEVKVGDMIYIDTEDDTFEYMVSEIRVVDPDDVSILEQDTDKEILTLYTCTPIYIASHRLVVIAERV
ncbi:MAG: class D sortase [Butyrivibrio sp.]|nr:class D sortase [Butyrivibrio sp.]